MPSTSHSRKNETYVPNEKLSSQCQQRARIRSAARHLADERALTLCVIPHRDNLPFWLLNGNVKYKAEAGPRHVAVYGMSRVSLIQNIPHVRGAGDILYTVLELTNEVTAHRFPPAPAEPTLLSTVPTLSTAAPRDAEPYMLAAEILIPPVSAAFPTPYMYVSNRNDPSPEGDTIAVFSLAEPTKPELVAEVRSGLRHLRGMWFGGDDSRWLAAGGVHGPGIKIFERIDGGKGLREVASLELDAPTGFLWV